MRFLRRVNDPRLMPLLVVAVAIGATALGCTSLAEDIATHLAEKDLKELDQEFTVFETDLGLFRKCVKERGGSCEGSDTTALPQSSEQRASQAIVPVSRGPSQQLSEAVAKLPAGHPAKSAMAVLSHPVVGQAAALHDHLRGHDIGPVTGFSVTQGQGAHGGPESTATVSLGVGNVEDLHKGLLSSLGTSAWKSLHEHCEALLETDGAASGNGHLAADCRRVAFIRGYLEAYVRNGQFLEVDVQLVGAIQAVDSGAAKIENEIDGLLAELKALESEVSQDQAKLLGELGTDAAKVGGEIQDLVAQVESDLTERFGPSATAVFNDLEGLAGELSAKAEALAQTAESVAARELEKLVSDLEGLLGKAVAELDKLEAQVATADSKVVQDINNELAKADATLSNVFKVSNVGFVSRDDSFQARLPALDVTLDPTAAQLVKVTDLDTGQILTGASDFGDLGVATDSSQVGTGSSIGAEVVRVFLEAMFDAHEGLPAVAPANQPNAKPTGLTLGNYSLPLFSSPLGNVDSQDLSHMTHTNDQVAAKTRAIASRIIAGIGPFSLNNQPLEAFLVEIITTSVLKATAKVTWCWYACNLNVDLETLEADAKTAATDTVKDAKAELEAKATQQAQHVKLRFKLSK